MSNYVSKDDLKESNKAIKNKFAKKIGVYPNLTAGNLVDTKATGVGRVFTFDTSGGSASIEDGSAAEIKYIEGNTLLVNQQVAPTNDNVASGRVYSIDTKVAVYSEVTDGTDKQLPVVDIKGNTINFKQSIVDGNFPDNTSAWTVVNGTLTTSNNIAEVTLTSDTLVYIKSSGFPTNGHEYLFCCEVKSTSESAEAKEVLAPHYGLSSEKPPKEVPSSSNWKSLYFITGAKGDDQYVTIGLENANVGDKLYVRNVMAIDLATMGLDNPSGHWVKTLEEFTELYKKEYYAYNTGTLYDSVISGVSLTGRNLWDEEWEQGGVGINDGVLVEATSQVRSKNYTAIISGYNYYVRVNNQNAWIRLHCYDSNKNWLGVATGLTGGNYTATLLSNTAYIKMSTSVQYGGTYLNDICINIDHGEFNGQYEPYHLSTISLPSAQTLGGIKILRPSSTAVQDEIQITKNTDNDYYTIKKIKRIERVDLGTKTWQRISVQNWQGVTVYLFSTQISEMSSGAYITSNSIYKIPPIIVGGISQMQNLSMVSTGGYIYVRDDSFSDESAFKSSLSGVILAYELATPVETILTNTYVMPNSLSGYNLIQPIMGPADSDIPVYSDYDVTYKGTNYTIPLITGHRYLYSIGDASGDTLPRNYIDASSGDSLSVVGGRDSVIDATKMYGGTPLGEWGRLYEFFPLTYLNPLAYTKGKLVNYKGTGIRTVGFNAYNHATGTARLIDGFSIGWKISGTYTSLSFVYDTGEEADYFGPDKDGYLTIHRNGVLTVEGGNDTDTCVHMVWSGYRDNDYEKYWSSTLDLPVMIIQKHATSAYIVGHTELAPDWLSLTEGGEPLTPAINTAYKVMTPGSHYGKIYFYDGISYEEDTTGRNLAFPEGMRSVGNVRDRLYSDKAVINIGSRSYESGDELNDSVVTDGVSTYYVLDNPIIVTFDDDPTTGSANINAPIDFSYKVADFGTEESIPRLTSFHTPAYIVGNTKFASDWLSLTKSGTPLTPIDGHSYQIFNVEGDYYSRVFTWNGSISSYVEDTDALKIPIDDAPLTANISYSTDFVRQLSTMPKNYLSAGLDNSSLTNLLDVIGSALGGVLTASWDETSNTYQFTFSKNEMNLNPIAEGDVISGLIFDTSKVPNVSDFNYTSNEGDLNYKWALPIGSESSDPSEPNYSVIQAIYDVNHKAYALIVYTNPADDSTLVPIYATQGFEYGSLQATETGWLIDQSYPNGVIPLDGQFKITYVTPYASNWNGVWVGRQ